jgi:hypothetical protein
MEQSVIYPREHNGADSVVLERWWFCPEPWTEAVNSGPLLETFLECQLYRTTKTSYN